MADGEHNPASTAMAGVTDEAPTPSGSTQAAPPNAQLPAYNWAGPTPDNSASSSNDDDSAIASTASGSFRTTSISSSVYDYKYENGRRYPATRDGNEYDLPNDDIEADRLDLQHHLFLLTLRGALHLSPLRKDVQRALDIGTGTGIWAVDFADQYPSAEVVGIDISPIQPIYVPPNCQFYIEDVEDRWAFPLNHFDFVHGRMIAVAIRNWPRVLSQAFDALKPGGWFELQDLCLPLRCDDGSAAPDSPLMRWGPLMVQGAEKLGARLDVLNYMEQLMVDAGFVDVRFEWRTWPVVRACFHVSPGLLGRLCYRC
jgi:SAM-dependent methyltransferase